MFSKIGARKFLNLPGRNFACLAGISHPFIAQPPGGPAVFGIAYDEGFAAMCGDLRIFPFDFNFADTVQSTVP